jgi:DNA mismatch repair protein MSH5
MDTHIGDLHSTIVDRELEIVQELLEEVLKCHEEIETACNVCAELDCLLSFATASRQNDYRRPEIVQDNILKIIRGR